LIAPGEVVKYTVRMSPTSNAFLPGHRIRLDITSSDFPNYDRNHNTDADQNADGELKTAEQAIHHGPAFATRIILPCVPAALTEEGYAPLFNGRNLDGWQLRRASRGGYVVEDGHLVCPQGSGGLLFTEKEYGDFSLRLEFRLSPGANSGVAIRCPLVEQRPAYEGMEIQIHDDSNVAKPLRPAQRHGSIYDVAPARQGALKPAGEWNRQEIICRGRRVTVIVNETVVLDADLAEMTDADLLQRHPGLARARGHIGLLGHGDRVEFRNLRIRELK
jgi:hypothetical protein